MGKDWVGSVVVVTGLVRRRAADAPPQVYGLQDAERAPKLVLLAQQQGLPPGCNQRPAVLRVGGEAVGGDDSTS